MRARQDFENSDLDMARAEVKAIFLEQQRLEQAASIAILEKPNLSPQQKAGMAMIEKTKVYDTIYVKHGVKFTQLMTAAQKYNIKDDPEVVELNKAHQMKIQQYSQKMMSASQLSPEETEQLKQEVLAWGPIFDTNKPESFLFFNHFLDIQKVSVKFLAVKHNQRIGDHIKERRQLLKDNKMAEYQQCVQAFLMQQ